ncbi:hypothetical protein TRIUR3_28829 [Triticum urartu]|uniref:Uncharacterized protein n=1 Tax=Triticum urartu TaxID=4572 RepID=M7Z5H7_TRIUA|nr:hypothetical protein TRIUR3_28829 [Triticum urartu]
MAAGGAEARAIVVGRQVQRVLGPLDEAEDDGVLLPGEEAPHRVEPEPRARGHDHEQQRDRVAEEEEIRVKGGRGHWCYNRFSELLLMDRRRLEVELGQDHFCSPMSNSTGDTGKSKSSSSPTTLSSWEDQSS